jgi:exodeoxyribonuclease V alpha subunit
VIELTRSYRFHPDRGIAKVSLAVRAGNSASALAEIDSGAESAEVRLIDAERPERALEALVRLSAAKFAEMLKAEDAATALRLVERFRVLCAHRRGDFGVEGVNDAIETTLRAEGAIASRGVFYRGRPILIQENDYELRLFNGDVGIVGVDPTRHGDLAVFFPAEGGVRSISTAELPLHETAYAMSIHKSQGSEFDEVAVVLPEPSSPLASRELVYTGLTRARHRAWLVATREAIAACVERPVRRASGLGSALWD